MVADRELARISRSFDFLLGVSPIDTVEQFERCRGQAAPEPRFRYRPLTVDPALVDTSTLLPLTMSPGVRSSRRQTSALNTGTLWR